MNSIECNQCLMITVKCDSSEGRNGPPEGGVIFVFKSWAGSWTFLFGPCCRQPCSVKQGSVDKCNIELGIMERDRDGEEEELEKSRPEHL